jgi:hypothetical protein
MLRVEGLAALSFEEKANQIKRFGAWFAIGGATFKSRILLH